MLLSDLPVARHGVYDFDSLVEKQKAFENQSIDRLI